MEAELIDRMLAERNEPRIKWLVPMDINVLDVESWPTSAPAYIRFVPAASGCLPQPLPDESSIFDVRGMD